MTRISKHLLLCTIAFLLSFAACLIFNDRADAHGKRAPAPIASPETSPTPSPMASNKPEPATNPSVLAPSGHVTFEPVEYYTTPAERIKVMHVEAFVNHTIHSQCFREFMIKQPLTWTNGRTPTQVADHLQGLSGVVPVKFYFARFSSAIAYRQPPSMEININRKYLGVTTPDCQLASTFAHESLGHSLGGYDHSFNWTREREDTVPYVMGGRKDQYGGDAFEACCK